MGILVKTVNEYLLVYREYCAKHQISDGDMTTMTVDQLVKFVETKIPPKEYEELKQKLWR